MKDFSAKLWFACRRFTFYHTIVIPQNLQCRLYSCQRQRNPWGQRWHVPLQIWAKGWHIRVDAPTRFHSAGSLIREHNDPHHSESSHECVKPLTDCTQGKWWAVSLDSTGGLQRLPDPCLQVTTSIIFEIPGGSLFQCSISHAASDSGLVR